MRFCMLTTFYPPLNFGGDGIYVEALSRALVAQGHDVTVVHCADAFALLSPGAQPGGPDETVRDGVRVIRLRSGWGWLSALVTQQTGRPGLKARRLREILDTGFDVVNYHNISLVGGPALLALPAGAALKVWTVHEHWLLCSTHVFWKNKQARCDKRDCLRCCIRSGVPPQAWRLTSLIDDSLAHVDAVFAPSRFTAELYRPWAAPKPVHVLPLFSALEPQPGGEATPQSGSTGQYFLYAGRVTASKGVRPMLQQIAAHPALRIKVAGGGDLLPALRDEFAAAGHIEFLGPLDGTALAALYAGAAAVVLPSLAPETFGLTIVEAMAFGTPAVVHDAGGSREIIDGSGAGFVFDDFAELPALLARLLAEPQLRSDLSVRARAAHAAFYTPQAHLRNYLALLDAVRSRREAKVPA